MQTVSRYYSNAFTGEITRVRITLFLLSLKWHMSGQVSIFVGQSKTFIGLNERRNVRFSEKYAY